MKLSADEGTKFRILPLALGNRIVPIVVLTLGAAIAPSAEELTLGTALSRPAWAGDTWDFIDAGTTYKVTLSDSVAAGEVTIPIVPRKPTDPVIPAGATAETKLTVYVAGVTDLPISGAQVTNQTQDLLSGTTAETSVTGVAYTTNLSMDRILGCPGQKLLIDVAMSVNQGDESLLFREFYGECIRPNGEMFTGAIVITNSNHTGAPGTDLTATMGLSWQGCSFEFTHAPESANLIDWPI